MDSDTEDLSLTYDQGGAAEVPRTVRNNDATSRQKLKFHLASSEAQVKESNLVAFLLSFSPTHSHTLQFLCLSVFGLCANLERIWAGFLI